MFKDKVGSRLSGGAEEQDDGFKNMEKAKVKKPEVFFFCIFQEKKNNKREIQIQIFKFRLPTLEKKRQNRKIHKKIPQNKYKIKTKRRIRYNIASKLNNRKGLNLADKAKEIIKTFFF